MLSSEENPRVIVSTFDSLEFDALRILKHAIIETGHASLKCGRPFLWVTREGQDGNKMEDKLCCKDELEKQGKIIITSKVPIVACPLWNDQVCNTKLIQDIWKNGVRVNVNEFNRCITIVMGDSEEGEELRRNVKKGSDLAKEAMKEKGTSSVNLKAFANDILLGYNEC
ncbi:hypothetical protein H5410_004557 [Solanum commersonii]|uniref:Uncharacterized protein n=1 Tax=Solanum commersonii TaxID=4109 RepID=A0A9J6B802_SOLCO|nr:hypothetical protein H5410_004557 [Solanum commersonii]